MKEIAQRKSNMYFMIIDDFNYIIQPSIDRSSRTNSNFKKLPLYSQMMKQNFIDTFRELYPSKKDFTQSNRKDSTRIDQVQISDSLIFGLKEGLIKKMTQKQVVIILKIYLQHQRQVAYLSMKFFLSFLSASKIFQSFQYLQIF